MNRIISYGLALLVNIGISNTCLAVVINDTGAGALNGTDVGMVDDAIMTAFLLPGPISLFSLPDADAATEEAWADLVLSVMGHDTTNLGQLSRSVTPAVFATDRAGVYASDISTDPAVVADYFIINNGDQWALFSNNANTDWAVFDAFTVLPDTQNIADLNVTHITLFSNSAGLSGATAITEPSALALMSLGILGIGFARRRKLNKR